jgi:hypothetical protein
MLLSVNVKDGAQVHGSRSASAARLCRLLQHLPHAQAASHHLGPPLHLATHWYVLHLDLLLEIII